MVQLKRNELWEYSIVDHPFFEKEIENITKYFNVTVGQTLDFYEFLGGDDILKPKLNIETNKINYNNLKEDDEIVSNNSNSNKEANENKKEEKKDKKDKKGKKGKKGKRKERQDE